MNEANDEATPKDLSADDMVQEKKHGFLRTNIEAFAVAIVLALTIKHFAFEAFRVPTPSMEPTIIGRAGAGDMLIVNKFTYQLRDPKRWEVVVFRYPLARRVNYVKRLIGLSGECVFLACGDILAGESKDGPFTIRRKPDGIQDAVFEKHPALPPDVQESMNGVLWRRYWDVPSQARFDKSEGQVEVTGKADGDVWVRTRFVVPETKQRVLTAFRHEDVEGQAQNLDPVSDLRLEVDVTPQAGAKAVLLTIRDWTQLDAPIRLALAVEGSGETSSLFHGDRDLSELVSGQKLAAGTSYRVALDNVDDAIKVWIDGDRVARHPYEQDWQTLDGLNDNPTKGSRVGFGVRGGKAVFESVQAYRDLYHQRIPGESPVYCVPEGHYFFLGDNSANSLDGRGFRVVGIRLREDGTVLLGDRDAVSDDIWAPRQPVNPYVLEGNQDVHYFMDIMGNRRELEPGSYDILNLAEFDAPYDELLELHGTKMDDPGDARVAYRAMRSSTLAEWSKPSTRRDPRTPPLQGISQPRPFVPAEEVLGRANLVFLSFRNNWGLIR